MKRYLALLLLGGGLIFSTVACSVTNATSSKGQEAAELAPDTEVVDSIESK